MASTEQNQGQRDGIIKELHSDYINIITVITALAEGIYNFYLERFYSCHDW